MKDLLGGSLIIDFGRRIGNRIKETARQSILFGGRIPNAMEHSGLAAVLNRVHPVEKTVEAMGQSRLLGWLYDYWGNFCALPMVHLLWLLAPLLGILALRMLLATRWVMAGGLLILLGVAALLLTPGASVSDWPLLGKRFSYPIGEKRRSLSGYLCLCGVLGGALGWFAGVALGMGAAVVLAVVPMVFSVPPIAMACILMALLPLCGTSVCWALSLLLVICYFFARAFGGQKGKAVDGVDLLLMIFPLFCVVSALFSFDRADSFKVIFMWLGLFSGVPFLRRIIDRRSRLTASLWSLTVGATASGVYGLFQYLSGTVNTTWTDTALFEELELRVYSTFANPNVYGEFLLMVIPVITGFALYCKGKKRALLLGIDLLLLINMVLTYSRGCYVGIALTALVFLWHLSKKWTVAAMALGVPLAILAMPESVAARILSIGNMNDTSTNYRIMIYIGTALMLAHYWLGGVGVGEGAYNAIYPYFALSGVIAPHSHSLFFQAAVSFGIAGFLYIMTVWLTYQRRMNFATTRVGMNNRPLMLGFGAMLWGLMVQSAFDYTWYNYRVFQLFWIMIVLGFAASEVLKKEDKS